LTQAWHRHTQCYSSGGVTSDYQLISSKTAKRSTHEQREAAGPTPGTQLALDMGKKGGAEGNSKKAAGQARKAETAAQKAAAADAERAAAEAAKWDKGAKSNAKK
jgi:hypothetical protein